MIPISPLFHHNLLLIRMPPMLPELCRTPARLTTPHPAVPHVCETRATLEQIPNRWNHQFHL